MPYAVRNAEGQVVSLHRHDPGIGDFLASDHPEVGLFLGLGQAAADTNRDDEVAAGFSRLDADFIRVLEDVVDALTSRNVINITDLPEVAQSKLYARKSFRERRNKNALDLFDPAELQAMIQA
jgi:hypothetical protein